MTNGIQPEIVVEGADEQDTFVPLGPTPVPNRDAFWFRARIGPGPGEVRFRITWEAIHRMVPEDPVARGQRLIDARYAWLGENLGEGLEPPDAFDVTVTDDGEVTVTPWEAPRPNP